MTQEQNLIDQLYKQRDQLAARDAEIERLREALEKVSNFHPDGNPVSIIKIATKALTKNQ